MQHRKKIAAALVGIIFTSAVFVFSWNSVFSSFPVLSRLNHILYDVNLKLFHKRGTDGTVVIVDIDEKSLEQEGKWPWPRNKIAELVNKLQKEGVAVIAFDILFPEQDLNAARVLLNYAEKQPMPKQPPNLVKQYLVENMPFLDNDQILAKALSESDVVLGVFFNNIVPRSVGMLGEPFLALSPSNKLVVPKLERYIGTIAPLISAAHYTGFVTTIPDDDGILRRSPLFLQYKNALYPALALEAVRLFLLEDKVSLDTSMLNGNEILLGVRLGNIYIPTDPAGNMLIPYKGKAFAFPYISAIDVLHNRVASQALAGKLVFIGSSSVGIGDTHTTPLQSAFYPGCEIHATIADAILSKNFLLSPIWIIGIERVLIVVVGVILTLLAMYFAILGLFWITLFGEITVFLVQALLWVKWHLVLPHVILPYFLVLFLGIFNLGYSYLFESRYRRRLLNLYGQYVSSAHIDSMLDAPAQYNLMGHSKEMSVLFADVRGFTSIAERLDANSVKTFLNNLFTPLTKIIFDNKGTIDKYVGDMVVAFWNDPVDDAEHAQNAVVTALKMILEVKALAPVFAEQGLSNIRIGVGVNSGIMHVGDMGSEYRKAYTVLGDEVNLASRLESSNKFYGTEILISEETKAYCKNMVFRFIDKVRVRGKEEAISIYEPICMESEAGEELQQELKRYHEAIAFYYARDWCKAREIFEGLSAQYPNRIIYQIYLTRLKDFICTPPPADWDWVYVRTEK